MSHPTYERNYISSVIAAIAFKKHDKIADKELKKFRDSLADDYKNLSEVAQHEINVTNEAEGIKAKAIEHKYWTIDSVDGTHTIEILDNSLNVVLNSYINFAQLDTILSNVFTKFFELFEEIQVINRVGLRYINSIDQPKSFSGDWSDYIADSLVSPSEFKAELPLLRAMSNVIYDVSDEIAVSMNAGIFNSYFPAPAKNSDFTLDFDIFSKSPVDKSNLAACFAEFNDIATNFFEESIEQNLREIMGVSNV